MTDKWDLLPQLLHQHGAGLTRLPTRLALRQDIAEDILQESSVMLGSKQTK